MVCYSVLVKKLSEPIVIKYFQKFSNRSKKELSNLEKYIDFSLQMALNISLLWGRANYDEKLHLQKLLFPGIFYNKEKHLSNRKSEFCFL